MCVLLCLWNELITVNNFNILHTITCQAPLGIVKADKEIIQIKSKTYTSNDSAMQPVIGGISMRRLVRLGSWPHHGKIHIMSVWNPEKIVAKRIKRIRRRKEKQKKSLTCMLTITLILIDHAMTIMVLRLMKMSSISINVPCRSIIVKPTMSFSETHFFMISFYLFCIKLFNPFGFLLFYVLCLNILIVYCERFTFERDAFSVLHSLLVVPYNIC